LPQRNAGLWQFRVVLFLVYGPIVIARSSEALMPIVTFIILAIVLLPLLLIMFCGLYLTSLFVKIEFYDQLLQGVVTFGQKYFQEIVVLDVAILGLLGTAAYPVLAAWLSSAMP
jgi:hypothetical protein